MNFSFHYPYITTYNDKIKYLFTYLIIHSKEATNYFHLDFNNQYSCPHGIKYPLILTYTKGKKKQEENDTFYYSISLFIVRYHYLLVDIIIYCVSTTISLTACKPSPHGSSDQIDPPLLPS